MIVRNACALQFSIEGESIVRWWETVPPPVRKRWTKSFRFDSRYFTFWYHSRGNKNSIELCYTADHQAPKIYIARVNRKQTVVRHPGRRKLVREARRVHKRKTDTVLDGPGHVAVCFSQPVYSSLRGLPTLPGLASTPQICIWRKEWQRLDKRTRWTENCGIREVR